LELKQRQAEGSTPAEEARTGADRFRCAIWLGLVLLLISLAGAGQEDRRAIKTVDPVYPPLTQKLNLQRMVRVEITIGSDGAVKFVKTVGGNPVLSQAVEDAVKQWKYPSGPVETKKVLQFKF
jgi:hypothetical protein